MHPKDTLISIPLQIPGKMKVKSLALVLLFLIFAAGGLYAQADTLTYKVEDNTIRPNLKFNKEALVLVDHYKHIEGIKIAKYYIVRDSLFINDNKGKPAYCLLVLSNMGQEGDIDNAYTSLPEGKRLLVVLKNEKGKYVIDYVNENVILNVDYSQSEPFMGIKRDSSGFTLKYFTGSVNKCTFVFYFNLEGDNFYLNKYTSDCYTIDLSKEKKRNHPFKDKTEGRNLRNIRVEGYLQVPDMGR